MPTALDSLAMTKLAQEARRAVLDEGYERSSCVLSARVAHEVLRRYGIPSRPMTVRWLLMNTEWLEHLEEIAAAGWDRELYPEAWSIGVGYGDDTMGPGKRVEWAGHLGVVSGRWLVDPSMDQASRPERGIVVAPIAVMLPEDGHVPDDGLRVPLGQGWGMLYRSPRSVPKRSRDWRDGSKWGPLVDRVMASEGLRVLLGR